MSLAYVSSKNPGLLQALVDGAVEEISSAIVAQEAEHCAGASCIESTQSAVAQTAIWQGEGFMPRGGLSLRLKVDYEAGVSFFYTQRASADVTARYEWVLTDGVLGLTLVGSPRTNSEGADTSHVAGINGVSESITPKLRMALETKVPTELAKEVRARQLREILDFGDHPYECNSNVDCGNSRRAKEALNLGLTKANPRGKAIITREQETELSEELNKGENWVCEQVKDPSDPHGKLRSVKTCNMLVRAKRVNVYPDSVELVFREAGTIPMTRESALEFAARGGDQATAMCDAPENGKRLSMPFQRKRKEHFHD